MKLRLSRSRSRHPIVSLLLLVDFACASEPDSAGPSDVPVAVDAGPAPDATLPEVGPPDPRPDGPPPTEPGAVIWQVDTGAASYALALDPSGNIVVAGGIFQSGSDDFFLAKYSQAGSPLVIKQFGGPRNQVFRAIKLAGDGTLVVTGAFRGTTDFGGQTRTASGDFDLFVASYTPELTLKDLLSYGGPGRDEGLGLIVDEVSGDWIVTGYGGPFGIGMEILSGTLLFRVAPTGTVRWTRAAGGTAVLELTKGGTFVAAGGGVDLSEISAHAPENGLPAWMTSIGDGVSGSALAIDPMGRVLVTGNFDFALDVRGQNVPTRGDTDLFVMAVEASTGQIIWADVVAASQGAEVGHAVCADRDGNVYVGGVYAGSEAIMPGEVAGPRKSILAKYREDGTRVWAKVLSSPTPGVQSLICDAPGGLVVGLSGALAKVIP
jgi:hypothetical protein